jgi:hypothetical protein
MTSGELGLTLSGCDKFSIVTEGDATVHVPVSKHDLQTPLTSSKPRLHVQLVAPSSPFVPALSGQEAHGVAALESKSAVPAGQVMHSVEAIAAYFPATHSMQLDSEVDPTVVEYFPPAQ